MVVSKFLLWAHSLPWVCLWSHVQEWVKYVWFKHSIGRSLWQSAFFSPLPWPSPQPFSPPSQVVCPPLFFPPSVPKESMCLPLILPFENTISAYYWVYKDLHWAVRVFPDSTKPLSSVDQFVYWSLTLLCQSLPPHPPLDFFPPHFTIHSWSFFIPYSHAPTYKRVRVCDSLDYILGWSEHR